MSFLSRVKEVNLLFRVLNIYELCRCGSQQPLLDPATQQACHAAFNLRQSSFRIGDDCVLQRCAECGAPREEYSDEELGLCIVILGTFIHREPGLAAPLLPKILSTVAK